jgi:SAM-dependent methyltransferase
MAHRSRRDDVEALLAEQIAYYRARAPEYEESTYLYLSKGELGRARHQAIGYLKDFRPSGDVLELACGPGTWTPLLARYADRVTAVDAATEMLEIAASKVNDGPVEFVEADLFRWEPDRRYDVVFFAFWLSHVPLERFEAFWSFVERALKPGGRVAFVDDAYRTPDELVEGEDSSKVRRRLLNGTAYHAVKVPHTPETLQKRLAALGWECEIRRLTGPFFWGQAATGERPRIETERPVLTHSPE